MLFRKKPVKPYADDQIGVLFVCMGNICRSPAGEGVFKHYVQEQGEEDLFYIDSAGTTGAHAGASADPRMIEAASQRGYQLDSSARKVLASDLEFFDLVLAMDFENRIHLRSLSDNDPDNLKMLGHFLPDADQHSDTARSVPDPYYGGKEGFEQVLDMVEQACPEIYQHCMTLNEKKRS